MQNKQQIKMIMLGMMMSSQDNESYFPGMDRFGNVQDASTEARFKQLVANQIIPTEILVSPYDNKTPWDQAKQFTSDNYSHALLSISQPGGRRAEWSGEGSGLAVALSDRLIKNKDGSYRSNHIKEGLGTSIWQGEVAFNDGSVSSKNDMILDVPTTYGLTVVHQDGLFTSETRGNDTLMSYTSSGVADPVLQKTDEKKLGASEYEFTKDQKYLTVNVPYATNRLFFKNHKRDNGLITTVYSNQRQHQINGVSQLKYGVSVVNIPNPDYQLPFMFRNIYQVVTGSPNRTLAVLQTREFESAESLRHMIQQGPADDRAYVYIHGYNNSFDDAMTGAATLAVSLGLKQAPVAFSWASKNKTKDYKKDEDEAEMAVVDFVAFLKQVSELSGKKKIVVIAHSMGTRIASKAISSLLAGEQTPQIDELILAAPDIQATVFREQLIQLIKPHTRRVTIYASAKDIPLKLREIWGEGVRLGETFDVIPGTQLVDATDCDVDFLGHGYVFESLRYDLQLLLRMGKDVNARCLKPMSDSQGMQYWKYVDDKRLRKGCHQFLMN